MFYNNKNNSISLNKLIKLINKKMNKGMFLAPGISQLYNQKL
jgi:hypothetical protein